MKTVQVELGGQTYEIAELPLRKNAAWRAQLGEKAGAITDLLQQAPGLELSAGNVGQVMDVVQTAAQLLLESADDVADLVFAYAPALEADRERILDEAYDSEIVDTLVKILRLAFPFGGLASRLATIGQPPPEISPNSPSPNGGSGKKTSTRQRT